jgi:hypothetical protein
MAAAAILMAAAASPGLPALAPAPADAAPRPPPPPSPARHQLGISAPQGCGKSTLVEQLEQLFDWLGVRAAAVSIDDFYLTNKDQTALAAQHPDNRLLQLRGNAGSHDLALGRDTLARLRGLTAAGESAAVPRWVPAGGRAGACGGRPQRGAKPRHVGACSCRPPELFLQPPLSPPPRYDKSAFEGRGDRADPSTWPVVQGGWPHRVLVALAAAEHAPLPAAPLLPGRRLLIPGPLLPPHPTRPAGHRAI